MRTSFHLLLMVLLLSGGATAAEQRQSLDKAPKTDIEALLKIQNDVQKLLPTVRPALVAIQTGGGTASGVIISADGLLLTAAHVPNSPGKDMMVILEDGTVTTAKSLGLDKTTDAALAKLKDRGKPWPFVNLSREVA